MIATRERDETAAWSRTLELEARLQGNLAVFEAIGGDDFRFRDHRPTAFALGLNQDGTLDLVDLAHGRAPVYAGDARAFAQAQVDAFRAAPAASRVDSAPVVILDEERSAHIHNSNQAIALLQGVPPEVPERLPDSINLMLMLGCGLGFQIEALLDGTDIRHLCVIEPEPDIFHASLHTLDWRPILEHFSEDGRTLELLVGEKPEDCYGRLDTWISEIGGFNVVRPYVFEHLVGRKTADSYAPFLKRVMPERTSLLGYFDDEQVGIAHTVRNLQAGVPVLQGSAGEAARGVPLFIAANGPSLDDALDVIRRCRDQMVLMSCGTSLGSLMKAGIRPDIHVEMERDSEMGEWIEAAATPADRAEMIVLGLNTVHPDTFALFPAQGMALKSNDLGTAWVADRVSRDGRVLALANCNPTVANTATSMAAEMGFEEIYLVGADFGFPAGEKHHSALSIHYDVRDEHQAALGISQADDARNVFAEGNHGGLVKTTATYQRAAGYVAGVVASHPSLTLFNLGAGLKIDGARPLRPEQVDLGNRHVDTKAAAAAVVFRAFGRDGLGAVDPHVVARALKVASQALLDLEAIAARDVDSVRGGLGVLEGMHFRVRALLHDPDTTYAGRLLAGSVAMFSLTMAQALHRTLDAGRNLDLYHGCRDFFLSFARAARARCAADLLTPDERPRNLEAKLA
jgi:hypothetical protein